MQALSDEPPIETLERKIDNGFAGMRAEFKDLRTEVQTEFRTVRSETHAEFKAVRDEVRDEFKAARGERNALVRTLIQIIGGSCAALVAGFLALVVSHL